MSSWTTEQHDSGAADAGPIEVLMPQMGVSVAEGAVVAWHKQVGDWVQAEETLCEISTDKIDVEVPAPASGRVAQICVELEHSVPVGTVLALIATDARAGEAHPDEHLRPGRASAAQTPAGASAPEGTPQPGTSRAVQQAGPAPAAASAPSGAGSRAEQRPGPATVAASAPGAPAPTAEQDTSAPGGAPAPTGSPAQDSDRAPAAQGTADGQHGAARPRDASAPTPHGAASPLREPEATEPEPGAPSGSDRRHGPPPVSPLVRRIAHREGIDLGLVRGRGRGGRVRKQDLLAHLAARPSEPDGGPAPEASGATGTSSSPPAQALPEPPLHTESPYRAQPESREGDGGAGERLSRMRRSIAEHMVRSLHTAAHCTSVIEVDMSAVEAARGRSGLSYLPYVARCVASALGDHSALNATLEDERLSRHREVHLGIAVSLGEDGLVVPVVRDAHELTAEGIARRIGDLAERARSGRLEPAEVHGATFTITNPGGFGTLVSTPIINQPQVAILDLEAVVRRPVAVRDGPGGEAIAIRPMAYLCLSWDHRALDGAAAARFLACVRGLIERWELT